MYEQELRSSGSTGFILRTVRPDRFLNGIDYGSTVWSSNGIMARVRTVTGNFVFSF
jgi:hypothetical protein